MLLHKSAVFDMSATHSLKAKALNVRHTDVECQFFVVWEKKENIQHLQNKQQFQGFLRHNLIIILIKSEHL